MRPVALDKGLWFPTDPLPYRPRPEGRFVRFIRSAARLIETFAKLLAWAGQIGFHKERSRWRLRMRFRYDPDLRDLKPGDIPTLRGERAVVQAGKIWRGEGTASTRFRTGRTNLVQGRTRGHLLWATVHYGPCSKLCGKDRSNIPIAFRGVSEESYVAWLARTRKKCAATDPAPGHFAANDAATAERP